MKLGIIRETKSPPDRRVPLTPWQCMELKEKYNGTEILVQPDINRCFSDREYSVAGVTLREDLSDCDILMGVKEVKEEYLVEGKTYLFFSHTAKKQSHNRLLLKEILKKHIRLIDYEYLTHRDTSRVVAFGRWAGIVGAYNGLRAYGLRNQLFELKPAHRCRDLTELNEELKKVKTGNSRFVLTGGGRVASGATGILEKAGILRVAPKDFLSETFKKPVYARLDPWHYTRRKGDETFRFDHFVKHPEAYENNFTPYAMRSDVYLACHFWDPASPYILTAPMMREPQFTIRIIADISCDIGGPIASTIRASSIAEPFYGYDPFTGKETDPFLENSVTVMAVDNLPGELPRDASADFGEALSENVIPALLGEPDDGMLERATIAKNGALTRRYAYLQEWVEG
ncbi:MAG: hypothetical protein JXR52_13385 [Bacteroidales bacterium]|nr:hypothetical protein [Bacteroidales bacterium]